MWCDMIWCDVMWRIIQDLLKIFVLKLFYLVMTVYRKRRIHRTKNLLTGEADISSDAVSHTPSLQENQEYRKQV